MRQSLQRQGLFLSYDEGTSSVRSYALLEYGRLFLQRGRLIFLWSGLFYLQWARPVVSAHSEVYLLWAILFLQQSCLCFIWPIIWGCLWLQWGSLSSHHLSSPLLMARIVSSLGYVIFFRGNLVSSLGNLVLLLVTLFFSWYLFSSLGDIVYSHSHFVSSFSKLASSLDNLVSSLGNLVSSLGNIISSLGNLVSFHGTLSLYMVPCFFFW